MNRTRCGSADLIRLLASAGDAEFDRLARAFGYSPEPENKSGSTSVMAGSIAPITGFATGSSTVEPDFKETPLLDTPFWCLTRFEPVGDDIARRIREADDGPTELPPWLTDPGRQPEPIELTAWRELVPKLRGSLAAPAETRMPDVPKIVDKICRASACIRLPKRKRRRWGQTVTVIEDRSDRLIPYWQDQARVAVCLSKLYPRQTFRHGLIWEGLDSPLPADPDVAREGFWPPDEGDSVIVLGDLGGLAVDGGELARHWAGLGARLRDAGGRGLALTPIPVEAHVPGVADSWDILAWERNPSVLGQAALDESALQLLAALSLASRIEPGLLREVRLRLGLPAAVESLVWQHSALSSRSSVAATLRADAAQSLRERFQALAADTQQTVLESLHRWRGGLPREVWFAEIQGLPKPLREQLPYAQDADSADDYFAALGRRLHGKGGTTAPAGLLPWYRFVAPRLRPGHETDGELGVHFQRLHHAAFAESRNAPELPGYDPALVGEGGDKSPRCYRIDQFAGELVVSPFEPLQANSARYSPLAIVESVSGEIKIEPQTDSVFDDFWETGQPPQWASDRGRDKYGAWVEFVVEGEDGLRATQTMRWIEPGSFLMGSPETEAEHSSSESPQHEVNIQQGYWLFDTACTQALWQAVMGKNPSRFKDGNKPVEQVSWNDAQRFIQALNQQLPGLDLSLPSEAQWEYACRAGTKTPFSFGDNITPEQVNYDGNYPYAGGKKGKYRKETVPVKSLPANPWGLYEMHGNVWEWVQDAWHDNYQGAPTDGSVWEPMNPLSEGQIRQERIWKGEALPKGSGQDSPESLGRVREDVAGAARVVRGGSWGDLAGFCRSAFRYDVQPGFQGFNSGFRCARVQGRESGKQAAGRPRQTRSGASQSALARPAAPITKEGTTLLRLDTTLKATAPLPQCCAFTILTDCEKLTLRQTQKPEWAKAMGRDRFGLWADIAVESKQGQPVIQRLRWIPPGRFMMGSPEGEPGRYDDEGPQHLVTISQGYWLFDTPCTQALWEAVLPGDKPSRFPDPDRPVERVSWDDIQQRFLPALNERIPGFILPNEAQWEYACRAGTDTALYTGGIEIRGDMDAPLLDPIAWYGGNSGVDYDLPEAEDTTTGWWEGKQKQYDHQRAGTRKVKGKLPNPWGVYDMLGNVFEWVEDPWHSNYDDAPIDGKVWNSDGNPLPPGEGRVRANETSAGAARVVRGGSWDYDAGGCRSAYRYSIRPDVQDGSTGFRCARVQS
ncbi:MAG: SUMF1/EgtB/PvdO family nonheme iron enzyme [Candidatus Methylumidiphilus sp.]